MEKDDASKKQQLKILTRSHQLALQEKDRLITVLEGLTADQESKITELEAALKGMKQTCVCIYISQWRPQIKQRLIIDFSHYSLC